MHFKSQDTKNYAKTEKSKTNQQAGYEASGKQGLSQLKDSREKEKEQQ